MAKTTAPRSTLVAVDTNFLLDMAVPKDRAYDVVELFRKRVRGVEFIVLPTVIEELQFIAEQRGDGQAVALASNALNRLVRVWEFRPIDFLPVGHGIVEQIARKLRGPRLIPEVERNDSLILAEAALYNCAILLTSDQHLRDADPVLVGKVLKACDVAGVVIRTPIEVIRQFG
jgi:rRNA-processing protein FCF1